MGKVGMCVKVLLSQTKIIIPDPVGEVPRDMSPFLCVVFLYFCIFCISPLIDKDNYAGFTVGYL